jgi:hypothetical protein
MPLQTAEMKAGLVPLLERGELGKVRGKRCVDGFIIARVMQMLQALRREAALDLTPLLFI